MVSQKRQGTTVKLRIECELCGGEFNIEVGRDDYYKYMMGNMLIQDAFPYLTEDERELFISQTCGTCWKRMYKDEKE